MFRGVVGHIGRQLFHARRPPRAGWSQWDSRKEATVFRRRVVVPGVAAVGVLIAVMTGTAVAAQVTIGSTSGKPSASICAPAIKCTYLTQLQVPSNGTVSSFSVNSGSASGTVWLRVVHFYHGSIAYVDTSPPQTLAAGVNTFNVSMGVQAGDQLALDNDSSALLFDTSDPSAGTVYFQPPLPSVPLTTAGQTGRGRLLLSATLQSSGTPTTTAPPAPPSITSISQSHRRWRLDGLVARFATAAEPPVGTTFRFSLNEQVSVRFAFSRLLPGRRVNGKCVAQTTANRNRPACTRSVPRGALAFSASAGPHQLFFQGRVSRTRKLKPGTYTLSITAVNSVAESVTRTLRSFMIVGT